MVNRRIIMEIKRVLAAAGLTVALGAFAPTVFAQVAGFPSGGLGGMPGAGTGTQTFQSQSPALGEPGTEAPASAAPIGAASSDFMASERNAGGEPELTLSSAIQDETRARDMEVRLEREIVNARVRGENVALAQRQKYLGSYALAKGDRPNAIRHFKQTQIDLREAANMAENGVQYNDNRVNLNADETDQTPNAVNMHPNPSARTVY
jgi:hypothetical protein